MKPGCDIVIAGAGIVGLSLAAHLAAAPAGGRLRLTLIDAQAAPRRPDGVDIGLRVSALSTGSVRLLAASGIDENALLERACPYRDMRVWDADGAADGPETLRFEAAEMALPQLGFIVENALLQSILYEHLCTLDIELRFDTAIAGIERTAPGFALTLADGSRLVPDLLIGADGARSAVRTAAAVDVDSWRYAQVAVVSHAEPAKSHRHTAWQRFLPDGPLALLPLADGRVSIVWSTSQAHAEVLQADDDTTFGRKLTEASDYVLGDMRTVVPRVSFPLHAQHARRYVDAGMALVGDAVHTVHPLAGQGANLGLADAASLAGVVADAIRRGEFPADRPVLRRYERSRKGANLSMLYFIDGLNRLFATDTRVVSRIRGTGMRLFDRSGPLKRQAMQVALGLD